MRTRTLHSWNLEPHQAIDLQRKLRGMVRDRPLTRPVRLVAGADVSYDRADRVVHAAVVVMTSPGFEVTETATASVKGSFPYVPGLLSFREGPALIRAFGRLKSTPDLVFFDGQGRAHPRRLGLASHLGLFLEIPSIGCAKSRLVGKYREPPRRRGGCSPLIDGEEIIGAVVRTRTGVRPVYVSVGHLIDLPSAVAQSLAACRGCRLPEPARSAHRLVTRLRSGIREPGGAR